MSARPERYFDKNGKLVIYQFGREQPRQHRDLLRMVPETAQITTLRTYHGVSCGSCVHFGDCSKPTVKNAKADQKYCAYPSRGYTGLGASVLIGQGALPPRDPWRDR